MNYAPQAERTGDGYKWRGRAAFTLASALDPQRTLASTKTKLISWTDKLGAPDGPQNNISAYSVGSPITEESASRMADDQWLQAMQKYHAGRPRDWSDLSRGGAAELAGLLGTFVAKEPARFAALARRFPSDAEPNYLAAVLRNLKDAAIPAAEKIAVARLVFHWPPANAAWSALDLLGAIEDAVLPADALEYIRRMAFDGPGPAGTHRRVTTSGGVEKQVDVRIDGLNSVRGHAIEAIARLVFHDRAYHEFFGTDIEKLTRDQSIAIQGCAAFAVYAMASHDPDRALALLSPFFDADPALHSSEFVYRIVKHGMSKHLEKLRPYVHRLLVSTNPEARRYGGIVACLARLHHPAEDQFAETALTGSAEARRGAAAVAESNLLDPKCRPWCEQVLLRLFDDPDEDVRKVATHCFWQIWKHPNQPLVDFSALIEGFLKSAAFATDPTFLLYALKDSKTRLPEPVLRVCEIFVQRCALRPATSAPEFPRTSTPWGNLYFEPTRRCRRAKASAAPSRLLTRCASRACTVRVNTWETTSGDEWDTVRRG